MANLIPYLLIIATVTTFVTSHPFHKIVNGGTRNGKRRRHHRHRDTHEHDSFESGDPLKNAFSELNQLTSYRGTNLSPSMRNSGDEVMNKGRGHMTNVIGNFRGSGRTIGRGNTFRVVADNDGMGLPEIKTGKSGEFGEFELPSGRTESPTREAVAPGVEEEHRIDGSSGTSYAGNVRLGPSSDSPDDSDTNAIPDNVNVGQVVMSRNRGSPPGRRQHPRKDRGGGDADCSGQACGGGMLDPGAAQSQRRSIRKGPPPVPLKSNTLKQVEDSRHVIVQYNDQLTETVPRGVLPPIPNRRMIVNLTGEEDAAVMESFGSFFHNFEEVPPSDNNFRRRGGRHENDHREKRDGGHVYVCSHERTWEQIFLAFSANNGLVQLYQTEELRQYVLTNRCTEEQSSVVPRVICVNEISTVHVVVLNFDTGLIQPTFINVETCRAKFVT